MNTLFRHRKKGFTLIELLIVMTIVSILAGLLIPAVLSARESANNLICMNNLAQWAKAVDIHLSCQTFYPTGGIPTYWFGEPDWGYGRNQPGGWYYNLLPYMSEAGLHSLGTGTRYANGTNGSRFFETKGNATQNAVIIAVGQLTLLQTSLTSANCPSARKSGLFAMAPYRPNGNPDLLSEDVGVGGVAPRNWSSKWCLYKYASAIKSAFTQRLNETDPLYLFPNYPRVIARGDYAFVYGTTPPTFVYSLLDPAAGDISTKGVQAKYGNNMGSPKDDVPGNLKIFFAQDMTKGLSMQYSEVKPESVVNGLSCMITIGEKFLNPDHLTDGLDMGDDKHLWSGMDNDNWRMTGHPPVQNSTVYLGVELQPLEAQDPSAPRIITNPLKYDYSAWFGGPHPSGVNFAFADGSVRKISFRVNQDTFERMGDRLNAAPIDLNALER
jgi:prepilin-type N-terminal cleavage/methylation domain-containing protein/prepilin-type processing-associated H-X9-DG protein